MVTFESMIVNLEKKKKKKKHEIGRGEC